MSGDGNSYEQQQNAEKQRWEKERAGKRRRNAITAGIVAVVVVVLAVGIGLFVASDDDDGDTTSDTTSESDDGADDSTDGDGDVLSKLTKDGGIVVDSEALGGEAPDEDAPEVVLYEDYYCPGCGSLEEELGEGIRSATEEGRITVEYRPVAILEKWSPDGYPSRAAGASVCVFTDGGAEAFMDFHDALFADQPAEGDAGPSSADLAGVAADAGASGAEPCITRDTHQDWAKNQTTQFAHEGYPGTPAIVIDGEEAEPVDLANLVL